MAITRFDPFREFMTVQERMNRLFGQAYLRDEELSRAAWVPPVDIYETENELVLKADVPDVDQKDIDVRVENHTLTIEGQRQVEVEALARPRPDLVRRAGEIGIFGRRLAVQRHEEDVGALPEDLLSAVAVVRVVVDHDHALAPVGEGRRGDGHVVEQAEPHRLVRGRVVPGRPDGEEG